MTLYDIAVKMYAVCNHKKGRLDDCEDGQLLDRKHAAIGFLHRALHRRTLGEPWNCIEIFI